MKQVKSLPMNKSSEKYKLYYTKSAFKDIRKLDAVARKKVKSKLELFSKYPLSHARRLTDPALGKFRWRVGDYRVVFDLKGSKIIILRVGHRKEVYH